MDSSSLEFDAAFLGGGADLELDPQVVSEEAGRLYSELQALIEIHGQSSVEGLLPVLVSVLESLAVSRSKLKDLENEGEREKEERDNLLEQFERERARRRETEERYLELDDAIEQERRTLMARLSAAELRARDMERKARECADRGAAIEEQKTTLTRELNGLRHTHNKLLRNYRDLLDQKAAATEKIPPSPSPYREHRHTLESEGEMDHGYSESISTPLQVDPSSDISQNKPVESTVKMSEQQEEIGEDEKLNTLILSPIDDIIRSTPELTFSQNMVDTSTPDRFQAQQDDPDPDPRNMESVFAELSGVGLNFVEDVDLGASLQGVNKQIEEIVSENKDLKQYQLLLDSARRSLISRVEELINERSELTLEVESLQDTIVRLEGRLRESEEESKGIRQELEEARKKDPEADLPPQFRRRFTRSEMSRVVMERNQYKKQLFDLQDALRRSQDLRASKEQKNTEERRSTIWSRFHRLFGLTKDPFAPTTGPALQKTLSSKDNKLKEISPLQPVSKTSNNDVNTCAVSFREHKGEMYREIRKYVWDNLGRHQIHGWSLPSTLKEQGLSDTKVDINVPALVQLRLLDQKDPSTKLWCAVAVSAEVSGSDKSSIWVISGTHSCSDVTILDPLRSNHVLDQFSLPLGAKATCIACSPPGKCSNASSVSCAGTVWIGTQEGSVFLHSAQGERRRCLQMVKMQEGLHSFTNTKDHMIAGLANGTLAIFSRDTGGAWDLQCHHFVSVGSAPVQPIRCSLAIQDSLWCGYWNNIHIINMQSGAMERSISVSSRREQQVRFLCHVGSGVWVSCRLDSVLRLYDCQTSGQLLQEVDMMPLVTATLGPSISSLSLFQVSCLAALCGRLWIGMGSGAIFSVPLLQGRENCQGQNKTAPYIPYCSVSTAQVCFHGHRDAVRFFVSVAGCINPCLAGNAKMTYLVMSGGEGYINFRIGDDGVDKDDGSEDALLRRAERSHMIIWQYSTPS
ncbi:C-Jun-amino-terminal kinase-interacting protein 4 [Polypterus senegalus]|uniref:C-Jun-amino-terminal kinase-interacting protein 4 n=1 Tax=Polypterus senegalus TaxID=55291 RepID=UPI0019654E89|nr:C-Jun-amino-terminal kinase-interacting protein 4 [Polypterus senegalus]